MKKLYDLYLKIYNLLTLPDNIKEKPVTFCVIDPRDKNKIIKMELQQIMVDQEGTVIFLKEVK
jgi:hypothetical protein